MESKDLGALTQGVLVPRHRYVFQPSGQVGQGVADGGDLDTGFSDHRRLLLKRPAKPNDGEILELFLHEAPVPL